MKNNSKLIYCSTIMMKALFLGIIFIMGTSINVNAQKMTSAQKKAFKTNFKQGTLLLDNTANPDNIDEHTADTILKYFLNCYALDSNNANVSYLIGKLYLSTAMHKAASLPYMEKAVKNIRKKYHPGDPSEKHAPPLAYYYLARAQHVNYQFDNAISNFNIFKKMLKPNDQRPQDIAYWVACCNSAKDLMQNPVDCKVVNMGEAINSTYDDYAPVLSADESQLYFTSERPSATGDASEKDAVWVSNAGPGKTWGAAQDLGAPINVSGGNTATVSLSPSGQIMVVYKSASLDNGVLYISKLDGNTWTRPGLIDSTASGAIDAKGSKYYTPSACITADGKTLYFSSDRPGGSGGLDLYKSDLQADGTWGSATNLGSNINTQYDEDAPFVSYDGSLLFFSSKGHNTMGGYDVFVCKNQQGTWGDPQNVGYPVNTPDDDKYFVLSADGKRAYYNTVRLGTMGERDIYEATFNTPLPVQCISVLVGYIKTPDGSPLPADASVNITSASTSTTATVNSSTGKFLATLKPGEDYSIVVTAGGKQTNSYHYTIPTDSAYCTISRSFFNGKIVLGDTTNVFHISKAPTAPMVASKFSSDPYFVKYFGYNLDAVTANDPDFSTLVNNISDAASTTKILVLIESSASTVPTTKFGSNEKLAMARAEALKKALRMQVKNSLDVKYDLKASVNGPAYANDANNHAKYEKYQYVKAYIKEAGSTPESENNKKPEESNTAYYSLVIGSFTAKEHADEMIEKFAKKHNVQLSLIGKNNKGLYMVGYGKFPSHNDAAVEQENFRKKYKMNTWIKKAE